MKKRTIFIFILLILFNLLFNIATTSNSVESQINYYVWEARKAGENNNFKKAIFYLEKLKQILISKNNKKLLDRLVLDQEIKVLKKLTNLKPVNNPHHYKILVIFIDKLKADAIDKNGVIKPFEIYLQNETEKYTKTFFNYQKNFIKAYSDGNIVVDVDYVKPGIEVKKLIIHKSIKKNEVDLRYLFPQDKVSKLLYQNYNKYDVFCFVWPKKGIKGDAIGGIGLEYSLFPYVKKMKQRGIILIPDTWILSPYTRTTFIHEIFHTIEYNLGIFPAHAWFKEKRNQVPEWKGETEYDYYQWRFSNIIKELGWSNLNYRYRFKINLDNNSFENYLKFLKYPITTREKAYNLTKQGDYKEALKLIPDYPYALLDLAEEYYNKYYNSNYKDHKNLNESENYLNNFLKIDKYNKNGLILKVKILISKYNLFDAKNTLDLLYSKYNIGYWSKIELLNCINKNIKQINKQISKNNNSNSNNNKTYNINYKKLKEDLYSFKIEIEKNIPKYFIERGYFYLYELKNNKKALKDFEYALNLDPVSWKSLLAIGDFYMQQKEYEIADKYYLKAIKNNPSIIEKISSKFATASYYEKDVGVRKALIKYAIELYPENPKAFLAFAFFYRKLKKKSDAIYYFKKSADLGSKSAIKYLKTYYNIYYSPQIIQKKQEYKYKIGIFTLYINDAKYYFNPIIKSLKEIEFKFFEVKDITSKNLNKVDLLIIPGGMSTKFAKELGKEKLDLIRNYVKNGGKYIGICAGANLALSKKYLWLFASEIINEYYWLRGTGNVKIEITNAGKKIFDMSNYNLKNNNMKDSKVKEPILTIRYANGPIIHRYKRNDVEDYTILATFKTGMTQNNAPDIMIGKPAIIYGKYGKGSLIVFIPHPEYYAGREILLINAIKFLLRIKK